MKTTTPSPAPCYKTVAQRGGQCGAATRNCALPTVYTDPQGRGWCRRHQPDAETRELWERNARVLGGASDVPPETWPPGHEPTGDAARTTLRPGEEKLIEEYEPHLKEEP